MLHNLYLYIIHSPWIDGLFHWDLNMSLHLQLKGNEKNYSQDGEQERNKKINLVNMIFMWMILHLMFKKCLNHYLRNRGYALTRRDRITNVSWSFGMTSIIIVYITLLWHLFLRPETNVIILKSFLIHYSGTLVFLSNSYLKGVSYFLLTVFIFDVPRPSLRPPISSIILLKSIEIFLLDVCRIAYFNYPKRLTKTLTESLYIIYCIFWTHLYMIYVPTNLLLPYKYESSNEKLLLWIWFITQYLSFVWIDFIRYFKKRQFLELCLFPNPSAAFIKLRKIFDNHKKKKNSENKEAPKIKRELWETLMCAMTMKKKINRLRKAKQEKMKNLPEPKSSISGDEK